MWYVIQVRTGMEDNIRIQCEKNIPKKVLKQCFIPYYEERRKITGEWMTRRRVLFPGYVFAVTDNIDGLFLHLKQINGLTKLIGCGQDIIPLTDEETEFLKSFGGEEQIVWMSQGIIRGSQVIVQSGPLQGKEGYIRKIDRHKRKAWLEVPMFGRMQQVCVGVEIVRKVR